jgi:hypothetical protein
MADDARRAGEKMDAALKARPGLVTFAAVMMFLFGGFQLLYGLQEIAGAAWVATNVQGTVGGALWLWGLLDLALAVLAFYAGYDLLRGGRFGHIFTLVIAAFGAVRWFFYIPAAPWVAVIMIAVDILIIYGLAAHADYFRSPRAPRAPTTAV